jgi:DNA-directed RNA polymerase subunit RPC12/RpoP
LWRGLRRLSIDFECVNTIKSVSCPSNEGSTITKKKKTAEAVQNYTCSNPSCGIIFTTPLRTTNIALEEAEPYLACPRCLTQIVLEETTPTVEPKQQLEAKSVSVEEKKARLAKERTVEPPSKTQCRQHFGYLSERSSKEKIPEECVACERIVDCMLKNIKSQKAK